MNDKSIGPKNPTALDYWEMVKEPGTSLAVVESSCVYKYGKVAEAYQQNSQTLNLLFLLFKIFVFVTLG
jgi:hypothetical protein